VDFEYLRYPYHLRYANQMGVVMIPAIQNLFYVGVGGFLGANARYILSAWAATRIELWLGWSNLPYGTMFVNVTGSFLLAIFGVWFVERAHWSESLRLLIATGFFGAYTTFSTYSNESVTLWRGGQTMTAIGYIALTNVLCLIGVVAGLWVANR
jgi:CrcB protein